MSHDCGIHTSFKLKPDTPKEVVEFFDLLYFVVEITDNALNNKMKALMNNVAFKGTKLDEMDALNLTYLLTPIGSVYFEAYNRIGKKDGVYYSFSVNRYCYADTFSIIFNHFIDYIYANLGDVLYRSVWYENETETLLYYDPRSVNVVEGVSTYPLEINGSTNKSHPSRFKNTHEVIFPFYNHLDITKPAKALLQLSPEDDQNNSPVLLEDPGYTFYVKMVKRRDGSVVNDLSKTDGIIYYTPEEAQCAIDKDPETSGSWCVVEMIAKLNKLE